MNIFNVDEETNNLIIDEGILIIPELAALFDKKYNKRERGFKELKYIYMIYAWNSPYSSYKLEERKAVVSEALELKDFIISDTLQKAIDKFNELQDSDRLIKSVINMRELIQTTDDKLTEGNIGENITVNDIIKWGKEKRSLLTELVQLEKDVRESKLNKNKLRGNAEKGRFEDGFGFIN